MTTKQDMLRYVNAERIRRGNKDGDIPIFRLFLFEKPNEEKVYENNGKEYYSGFPDLGASCEPGFYDNLNDAIAAMNENVCDIREAVFNAGFILCHFQGVYNPCITSARMYFVWDETKKGFYQKEEPKLFHHIALLVRE